ncbi:hypothetical protein Sme01_68570 [Sphaerisporangium melleum]|uniref:Uncharacterized protein n=1 Tax=Sphaerisporangium melleum TaxID=321316 RepID=A0A917RKR2_9ACTN|nr:hypothetical protein GCM10007964_62600 [Sphaerisporangium melleum]GII74381.1 hypothetical protein Sme01_68570 [Sphaerisporangium melleum]
MRGGAGRSAYSAAAGGTSGMSVPAGVVVRSSAMGEASCLALVLLGRVRGPEIIEMGAGGPGPAPGTEPQVGTAVGTKT